MGEHRATISIKFTMHEVTTECKEMWINWWPTAAPNDLPSAVTEFFERAQSASMNQYYDWQDEAEDKRNAEKNKLIEQAKAKLTPEEIEALKD